MDTFLIVMIPFLGTALGACTVFFVKGALKPRVQKSLLGFASGVMVAASVWSLLIPALDMAQESHASQSATIAQTAASASSFVPPAWLPAAVGFLAGIAFLLALDALIPHLHPSSDTPEGPKTRLKRATMLMLAVTLHNIPEGIAVGVVFAGYLKSGGTVTTSGALALAVGIAIQNFPEGAIISLPLKAEGEGKAKAFTKGALSGIVEPIAALLTIAAADALVPLLPYVLAFAAGAMMYVVVEELIPESAEGEHSNVGTVGFALGFVLMMILDVALG